MNMSDDEDMDDEYSMDVDEYDDSDVEPSPAYPSPGPSVTAVPPKGRKRFLADLQDLKKSVIIKLGSNGYALKSASFGD